MFTNSELRKLSIEDLRELQTRIKYIIQDKVIEDHQDIRVGSWVKINHRKCIGKKYIVEKINRKTYILGDGKGARIKASLNVFDFLSK